MRTKSDIPFVYENDCPTEEQALLHAIFGASYHLMRNTEKAYKPNGITDNRYMWRKKELNRLFPDRLIDDEIEFYRHINKNPATYFSLRDFKDSYYKNTIQ